MTLSAVVALLQAALLLITAVQSTPAIPPALRDQALQVAQHAISAATSALAAPEFVVSIATTTPTNTSSPPIESNFPTDSSPESSPEAQWSPTTPPFQSPSQGDYWGSPQLVIEGQTCSLIWATDP